MTHHIRIEAVAHAGSQKARVKVSPRVLQAKIGDTIVWDGIGGTPEIILESPSGPRPVEDSITVHESGTLEFRCSLVTPGGKISWDSNDPESGHMVEIPSSGGR